MLSRYASQCFGAQLKIGLLVVGVCCAMGLQNVHAQFDVEGTVVSAESEESLPGVNVVEVGTQRGTSTDTDGTFELTVSGENATLRFSFVGYQNQTVSLDGRSELTVQLQPEAQELKGLVVTALGIERQQRSVGYSVSKISGEDVSEVPTSNFGDALSGKLSGVDVNQTATGPGGSSNVTIRGITSLTGDNQPLYVVDGVPIDNSNLGSANQWGGRDRGDGLTALNPNDIEEVSVLKGASAAALYGERASNGVVLITTKSGSEGLGVEFSSTTKLEEPQTYYDEYQYQYGQGSRGEAPSSADEACSQALLSWGAPMDEVDEAMQVKDCNSAFDGVPAEGQMAPYEPVEDNIDRFYQTGVNTSNSIALNGGTEETTFRLSVSNRRDRGTVPNSRYERTSFLLRGSSSFGVEGLSADAKANYVRENADNRPRLSDAPGNANYSIGRLPTSLNVETLSPGHREESEFQERTFTSGVFITNPYWAANSWEQTDTKDRLLGFAELRYALTDWLTAQGRVETDTYWSQATNVEAFGTAFNQQGQMTEEETNISEINSNVLLTVDHSLTSSVSLSGRFGGNFRRRENETIGVFGNNFNGPGLRTIGNTQEQSPFEGVSRKEVWSLYGSAEFSYKDYAFLSVTGRNDWASTLPVDANSYFYPSVSGSFVFSDALTLPDIFSYGKLRAAWAQVGGDTNPFRTALTYQPVGQGHLGRPLVEIAQSDVPNQELQPSIKTDIEAGIELGFFNDRLGLDFSWYRSTVTNDIVPSNISITSGYNSQILNVGETRNTGVEIDLRTTPVELDDFSWDLDINASQNNNKVVKITEDTKELSLGTSRTFDAFTRAREGEPYGAIKGTTFKRDDQGRLVLDGAGLPQPADTLSVLGHFPPDWTGGITNTLNYKGFSLRALLDVQIGGDLYSATNGLATNSGLHERTLRGREDGIELEGVDESGNEITSTVSAQDYFQRIAPFGGIAEEFVYDASYVKLRELRLAYRLPSSLLDGFVLQSASVALSGRNLWILHKNVPNIDPESTYNRSSQQQGLEMYGVPQTRSIGFDLNLRF